ncbi:hypothetical protein DZ860_16960 [Vibrio sinensis]|uniref:DNA binding HTH domain-containing protein n=1 Tax=Vibrio sinensis TaxID=2302434 RepID=A0A3A6Q9W4_9VIBR|nr:helix-turn-helix domain-containing protein [Vibrio sinensis]RJX68684.1 hypothetical protein DZ860_16960 [Vibrio sinensis]
MNDKASVIIDRQLIKRLIRQELEPTLLNMESQPDLSWVMPMVKDELFKAVLAHTNGNQSKAARILGINRGNYTKKIQRIKHSTTELPK